MGNRFAMGASTALPRGARLQFGRRRAGARAYLAVERRRSDAAASRQPRHASGERNGWTRRARAGRRRSAADRRRAVDRRASRRAPGLTLPTSGRARLRVLPGPQADWFRPEALDDADQRRAFASRRARIAWAIASRGRRCARQRDDEPISEPVAFGAIQVPAAGEPILLMADRQTAGGYPKIASVIAADLPLAGQLAPGDFIEFACCSRQRSRGRAHCARAAAAARGRRETSP